MCIRDSTIGLYLLQIQVLKKISAFTINLSYNLEPIYVESVLGQGSCFTLKLPIDKESYSPDELLDETMVLQTGTDDVPMEDYASSDEVGKTLARSIATSGELTVQVNGQAGRQRKKCAKRKATIFILMI